MNKTRFTLAVLLAVCLYPVRSVSASEFPAELGTDNFTVLLATGTYTQSATTLTLTSPFGLGDLVGGSFGTVYDWSGISSFGLSMSAPGANPNIGFTVEFFNAALDEIINAYQGSASGLTTTPSFVPLNLSLAGTGDLSSVGGLQFTWDGASSGDVVIAGVVPEPSTWVLLSLGGVICAGAVIRRRWNVKRA
jgi:hypothetical protein